MNPKLMGIGTGSHPIQSKLERWNPSRGRLCRVILLFGIAGLSAAQDLSQFTGIERLTNREVLLTLSNPNGLPYRIETSTNLPNWHPLLTSLGAVSNRYTDSAAPFYPARFYRATALNDTNILTGDHLVTTDGDVIIHPMFHATVIMTWNGKVIYNDPDDDPVYRASYQGLPKADLLLVSHVHGDHFSATQLDAVRGPNAVIVAPQAVYDHSSMSAALRSITLVLTNGASTNVMGLTIDAVPAYNANHPVGTGNGYVLTMGGKRIYLSGDTGNIAEMRALQDIDVAFVCMNSPFTMTVNDATNAVRAFRPGVVYPYHYRNQDGSLNNANLFKQQLGTGPGIEVRLRKWY